MQNLIKIAIWGSKESADIKKIPKNMLIFAFEVLLSALPIIIALFWHF